jgi:GIY-YIG catalytic domain-containing protein
MKIPAIQKDIVAHLRSLGSAETSRALATRFLRIEHADEETCRRLLAPFLATVPGVVHRPEEGWSLAKGASRAAAPAGEGGDALVSAPAPDSGVSLGDFVAFASEGTGPAGSGALAVVTLLPVLAGEECQEEIFPDWALDDDARPPDARPGSGLSASVLEDLIQTIGDLPIVCHRLAREVEPLRRLCAEAGIEFHAPVISAAKLGHLLLGLKANHAAVDLAQALGVETRGPDDCRGRARIVAASFLRMLPLLEERGIDSLSALLEYQDMPSVPLDLSGYAFTAEDLKKLPAGPGAYRFLDREGRVLYVGKAKNLRVRVASYFTPSARGTAKGRAILDQVHRLQIDPVASELEANLLEAALIAEHQPTLNRQFDVHERPAPYGPRLNLVVVLRDAADSAPEGPTCTFHILRGGRYVQRVGGVGPAASGSASSWTRIRTLIARLYFPDTPGTARPSQEASARVPGDGDGVDIDWRLVASFLRKYRDAINVLDVDECASPEETEERLRVLAVSAVASPGRTLAR